MPPSHCYLTVQGSAGKTNINTTKSVSHTQTHAHTHMQANENQWILLRKLSLVVAYFAEYGVKQTFVFHCISQGAELHSDNRMIRWGDGTYERATDHY